jgi:hypothetical protein
MGLRVSAAQDLPGTSAIPGRLLWLVEKNPFLSGIVRPVAKMPRSYPSLWCHLSSASPEQPRTVKACVSADAERLESIGRRCLANFMDIGV